MATWILHILARWTKSVRLWERLTIENLLTKWKTSTWTRLFGEFMSTTFQAASHLGQDYDQILRFVKNHFWSSVKKLFKETEKLFKDQKEITGVSLIDYADCTWSATNVLCDRVNQILKTCVFADSALCLGGTKENRKLGKRKIIGILRMIIWKIRIVLMWSRWSSSRKYSQDSQYLASSRRFKV